MCRSESKGIVSWTEGASNDEEIKIRKRKIETLKCWKRNAAVWWKAICDGRMVMRDYVGAAAAAEGSCRSPSCVPRSSAMPSVMSRGNINSVDTVCRQRRTRYRFCFGGGGFGLGTPVVSAGLSVRAPQNFVFASLLTVCAATHEHRAVAFWCDHECRD